MSGLRPLVLRCSIHTKTPDPGGGRGHNHAPEAAPDLGTVSAGGGPVCSAECNGKGANGLWKVAVSEYGQDS